MQAGRRAGLRSASTRQFGASGCRFPSLFDGGREVSRAATHVDACDGVLSDADSTPAASTTYLFYRNHFAFSVDPVSNAPIDVLVMISNRPHAHPLRKTNPAFELARTQSF